MRGAALPPDEDQKPQPAGETFKETSLPAAGEDKDVADLPPRVLGRLRSGREQDRPSEDDVVRERMGARGVPGVAAPANTLPENETQIPKPLDPGHTA